jgi:[ribosomal protein S18]-alanine N-acetyltransferase
MTRVWQLRRARADDLESVMAIESAVFGDDAWSHASMEREFTDPNTYYLVAFAPDEPERIDAYAGLLAPRGSAQGDIQTIAVSPGARGAGLGRVLLRSLLAEAWRRGAAEVFLEVRADNPVATALYDSLGFERIGVRPRYYRGGIDAILMRLRLSEPEAAPTEVSAQ